MPVKLRLRRQGRKKAPHYAIVAADSRAPRDGRYIEKIGHYNPVTTPAKVFLDHELAMKWLKVGAQPTHTVKSLLRHAGITVKFALFKQGKTEEEAEVILTRWLDEKQKKKQKKVVMVDVHGNPLEDIGEIAKPAWYNAPKPVEQPVEEVLAEEAAVEAGAPEEQVVAEASAEEAPAEVVEAAADEAPAEVAEAVADEAPAEAVAEEAPAEVAEAPVEEGKEE
ncbi:MAG: 30S ribosomal protein S16 [Bacteroidota bacterium]